MEAALLLFCLWPFLVKVDRHGSVIFWEEKCLFLSDSHLLIKVKHDNACFASLLRRFFFCEQGFFWRELTENYSVFQEKKRLILRKLFLLQLFAWHKNLEMRHPWIVPFGFNGAHLLSGVEYGSFRCLEVSVEASSFLSSSSCLWLLWHFRGVPRVICHNRKLKKIRASNENSERLWIRLVGII